LPQLRIKEKTKQKIIQDYQNGLGTVRLSKKYHRSQSGINYVLLSNGVKKRCVSEALKVRRVNGLKKWRFISRRNNGSESRLVNIPFTIFEQLGFGSCDLLIGKWSVQGNRLFLEIKKVDSDGRCFS
jgi:hypothetical protein